jgi:uncharacterized protein (DUF1778 family)
MNYKKLEQKIISSYTDGVTLDDAEKLAAEFLDAQIQVSQELKRVSLESRLLKSVVKEERAKVLYKAATESEKKPSDSILQALVDSNLNVLEQQNAFDKAEEETKELDRMFSIFRDAHIYYRGISRAKFE